MTTNFSNIPGGFQLRGDNNVPYMFTEVASTTFQDEFGEKNKKPFVLLGLVKNESYWKEVEVKFLKKFDSFEDFKTQHPNIDFDLYIHYENQTNESDLILNLFKDIEEYINHK
jgi:hypothetical protein